MSPALTTFDFVQNRLILASEFTVIVLIIYDIFFSRKERVKSDKGSEKKEGKKPEEKPDKMGWKEAKGHKPREQPVKSQENEGKAESKAQ